MRGLQAFREEFVTDEGTVDTEFGSFEARRVRYAIFWSMFEATAYRNVHDWAQTYKTRYALYRWARSLYNPAYRLGEFWKAHTWGGALDPAAGDGLEVPSALPIITEYERLREPIATLWKASNWNSQKDITTLHGAVLGDTFLRIVDDTDRGKVYLDLIDPATVADITVDGFGSLKGYVIEESRPNPNKPDQMVDYREECFREGDMVVYQTYLNNAPYPWNGIAAEWELPYGFVPVVHIKHNDVGRLWGWSELHPVRSKVHEVDDVTSMLSDQIRKTVSVKWLFNFKRPVTATFPVTTPTPTQGHYEPGREEENAIYSTTENANAIPLVAPLDITGTLEHITGLLEEIERDYPELKLDRMRASGDVSGKALRVARQPTETKVLQRRANYDHGLARAHMMAISIGGFKGYDGYAGFNLDSYSRGDLEHHIGRRPVFSADPMDELDEDLAFWTAAKAATESGLPLESYLLRGGWTQEDVDKMLGTDEMQRRGELASA
jgi:hypothetical protein